MVQEVLRLPLGTRDVRCRRAGSRGTSRSPATSRQDRRTGCGRSFQSEHLSAAPKRSYRNTAGSLQHRRASFTVPTRSAVCVLLGVFNDVPLPGHGEWRSAERAEHAIELPVLDDRSQDVVVAAAALPRQLVREAQLEVVPAVEPRGRPVAATFARACSSSAVALPSSSLSFIALARVYAPLNSKPVRKRLVERNLQRIVVAS